MTLAAVRAGQCRGVNANMPLKGKSVITCGSQRDVKRQVGVDDFMRHLVQSPSVSVTVAGPRSVLSSDGLPTFHNAVANACVRQQPAARSS